MRSYTKWQRIVTQNGQNIRDVIRQSVNDRKDGKVTSQVKGNADLLSLFLENSDVFTDEVIVDELLGFFGAAVYTTQYTI